MSEDPQELLRLLPEFRLADLEAIRLLLRGGSVIDWHRLNFDSYEQAEAFLRAQEFDISVTEDAGRVEDIKRSAVDYLRRNFEFPIPRPVAEADVPTMLMIASGRGHRRLCACTILKVMHIIHHLDARELMFLLPASDKELFYLVEQKVYRVIGGMLSRGFPILEFIGGRKNKDSLYTKLLSKSETTAAQIYDKIRFRIVTRTRDDIFPVLEYLTRNLFPFNYVVPGESTNTLFHFKEYCSVHPNLKRMIPKLQLSPDLEAEETWVDNRFTSPDYRIVHFVVDMPVRLSDDLAQSIPTAVSDLGRVIFVQTEFQVIDRETEQKNELGNASHSAYKDRQRFAVMRRLKLGMESQRQRVVPSTPPPPLRPTRRRKR